MCLDPLLTFSVHCWLSVACCCTLSVDGRWLSVVCCLWLYVVCCVAFVIVVCGLLFAVCFLVACSFFCLVLVVRC